MDHRGTTVDVVIAGFPRCVALVGQDGVRRWTDAERERERELQGDVTNYLEAPCNHR